MQKDFVWWASSNINENFSVFRNKKLHTNCFLMKVLQNNIFCNLILQFFKIISLTMFAEILHWKTAWNIIERNNL